MLANMAPTPAGECFSFPRRLSHVTPAWVRASSFFHVRIRTAVENSVSLIEPRAGKILLQAARHYHYLGRWHCRLFLLMPDHRHALLAFPAGSSMSRAVGDWKRYTARATRVVRQTNYFDHRVRTVQSLQDKFMYVRRNPVVKGFCPTEDLWPWQWIDGGDEG